MRPRLQFLAPPLLGLALLALAAGLWGGLARMGLPLRVPEGLPLIPFHGPLMSAVFLGTVVALERAVALRAAWAFLGPLLIGLAGPVLAAAPSGRASALLVTLGGVVMTATFVPFLRRAPQGYMVVMALGAASFAVGGWLWRLGEPVHSSAPWWIGFVVLTVAGERWERSRMRGLSLGAVGVLVVSVGLLLVGLVVARVDPRFGLRPLGVGLLAVAAWMLLFDVAWAGFRGGGSRRFLASCLLSGHAWLAAGGLLALVSGDVVAGPTWDALLHSIFFGFLFSMIFGHAPIVMPSVLGVPIPHRSAFYLHLALLHASLLLRLGGDLLGSPAARRWGGVLGVVTLAAFFLNTVLAVRGARRAARPD